MAFFREHPVSVFSLLSGYMMALALFNTYNLLSHYGINVISYLSIEDLLMLAFRNVTLLGLIVMDVLVLVLFVLFFRSRRNWAAIEALKVSKGLDSVNDIAGERDKLEKLYCLLKQREYSYSQTKTTAVIIYFVVSFGSANMAANWEYTDIKSNKSEFVEVTLKDGQQLKESTQLKKIVSTSKYLFVDNSLNNESKPLLIIPMANILYLASGEGAL